MKQEGISQPFAWKILAIAGSSGTGKTMVAQRLAQHFGISVLFVDDIRLALQQVTTPTQQPELHIFLTEDERVVWGERTPEQLRDSFITVGKAMAPPLEVIMAHHVVVSGVGSLILEGDAILPQTVASPRFHELKWFYGLTTTNEIRSVFLYEPDQQILLQNLLERGRGFHDLSPLQQQKVVQASWLYGQWLRQEAQTYHLPVVACRPWATLFERVLEAIG